jgi:hypothetical protein
MGIVRRIVPNSASFRSKAALIVGIREAQLEKLTPERKKNTLRATLCLLFKSIVKTERAKNSFKGFIRVWLLVKFRSRHFSLNLFQEVLDRPYPWGLRQRGASVLFPKSLVSPLLLC